MRKAHHTKRQWPDVWWALYLRETFFRRNKEFSMNYSKVIIFGEINLSDLLRSYKLLYY